MYQLNKKQRLDAYKTILLVYISLDWVNPESLASHFNSYLKVNYPNLIDRPVDIAEEFPELSFVINLDESWEYYSDPAITSEERKIRISIIRDCIRELDITYTPLKSLKVVGVYLLTYLLTYLLFCLVFLYYTDDYLDILSTKQVFLFYTLYIGWWLSLIPSVIFWKRRQS